MEKNMSHGPSTDWGADKALAVKTRIGIIMFIVYGLVYAGFIAINVISPKTMSIPVLFGVNLAIIYGMGLIVLAIILGLVYNFVCTKKEDELNKEEGDQ
jgi:uncharacterized membrane protein (DUF485 family)